ncbi:hypothetical protein [Sulfurimonas sp.]|uniref:hypothetical protein n=1 Tax=Sulfurimonas sp. TaxID=2022749 RepID=UPI003D1263FC
MKIQIQKSILEKMDEIISLLPTSDIKDTLNSTMKAKADKFSIIENVFQRICSKKYSDETMSVFLNSWKLTHLKMLPIYGLSCRINLLGMDSEDDKVKLAYLESSAYNAKTSHEDLGLGFNAISHGQLYDEFAFSLVKSDEWKLEKFEIPKAKTFSKWVYNSMLLNPIEYALCINMVSEFYNHAEYAYSYDTFKYSMTNFYNIEGKELEDAIRYIDVHNEYETEIHHFLAVLESIYKYEEASGEKVSMRTLQEVINTYVDLITEVFESLVLKFD